MEAYETLQHANCTIEIIPDEDSSNPRTDWDQAGTMVCWHSRYDLGDKNAAQRIADDLNNAGDGTHFKGIHYCYSDDPSTLHAAAIDAGFHVMPLFLYDHSGITMNTSGFSCPWDSGQVGFIYMTPETAKAEGIPDPLKCLKSEVTVYDQYLTGDVFGFIVEHNESGEEDSCWGFYGSDYCIEEAKSIAESLNARHIAELVQAKRNRQRRLCTLIRNRVPLEIRQALIEL
jgi:hypothetical protein